MARLELFVSLSLLAFSCLYLAESLTLGFGNSKLPGPGLLPTIVGIFLAFLVSLLLITDLLNRKRVEKKKKQDLLHGKDFVRLTEMLLLLGFCGLVIGHLGYMLTTIVLVGASLYFLEMRGWVRIAFISIFTSGASYYFFRVMFDIPLPQGILPF